MKGGFVVRVSVVEAGMNKQEDLEGGYFGKEVEDFE
jgi:hypothetical protein